MTTRNRAQIHCFVPLVPTSPGPRWAWQTEAGKTIRVFQICERHPITAAVNCCLAGSALTRSWNQEAKVGFEPRHSKVEMGTSTARRNTSSCPFSPFFCFSKFSLIEQVLRIRPHLPLHPACISAREKQQFVLRLLPISVLGPRGPGRSHT